MAALTTAYVTPPAPETAPLPATRAALGAASRSVTRWLALSAVAGPVLFTLAWFVLGFVSPGFTIWGTLIAPYSPISAPISGLGLGPTAPFMNAAFVLGGLLLLAGVGAIFQSIRELGAVPRRSCSALLALTPLGSVIDGIFTLESGILHFVGFVLACATPVLSFPVAGLLLRRLPRWRRFGSWLLLGGPLTLALVVLFFLTFSPTWEAARSGVAGLTQRILVTEVLAWFAVMGWLAFRSTEADMSISPATAAQRKPYGGMQMEGPLARWYARTTRDRHDHLTTAQAIAAQLAPGSAVLEVAPGPGYMAVELAKLGAYCITGLDISRSFVRIATDNARQAGVAIDFRHGDVAHIPFPADSFDYVVCQAAFKNFPDPVAALDEMHRVLRPGGRASIIDLRKDAPLDAIEREVLGMHLSPLNAFVTKWIFRLGLLRAAYTREALEAVVARSRFGRGEIVENGIGFELQLAR